MAIMTFDQSYYLANNLDVQTAVLNGVFASAQQHYEMFGEKEGRMPNSFFDAAGYLAANADVFAAVQNHIFTTGLEHYENYGAGEQRTPGNITYNEAFYLAENPDVAAAVGPGKAFASGYQHYVLFGAGEGRLPAEGGDVQPGNTFTLTPGVDFADSAGSSRNDGTIPSDFRFTTDSETVIAPEHTFMRLGVAPNTLDGLIDASTADNDMLQVAAAGAAPIFVATTQNIETLQFNFSGYTGPAVIMPSVSGAKTIDLNGALAAGVVLNNLATTGVTTVDGSGLTSVTAGNGFVANFSAAVGTTARSIVGSGANDFLTGADGADTIDGAGGVDFIDGGSGNDTLTGGGGNDTILGSSGTDTIDGGSGNDTLNGGDGDDTVTGAAGDDALVGGNGNDALDGGDGVDAINGGAGNDTITGGAGNDVINAGGGSDTVTGGAGNDAIALTIDAATDTLVFGATASDNGNDSIADFLPGGGANADKMDFAAFLGGAAKFVNVPTGVLTVAGLGFNATDSNVIVVDPDAAVDTQAELQAAIGNDDGDLKLAVNSSALVFIFDGVNADGFYVTTNALGEAASLTQAVELAGVDTNNLAALNFV